MFYLTNLSFSEVFDRVTNNLTHIDISDHVEYLLKEKVILERLDVSQVVNEPFSKDTPSEIMAQYRLTCFAMDIPPMPKDEDEKTLVGNSVDKLLLSWQHALDPPDPVPLISPRDREVPEKEKRPPTVRNIQGILAEISAINNYISGCRLHQELETLKLSLMFMGNCYAHKNHLCLQKYFYDPKLIEICIDLKAYKYCRDIQFLAFSLLTTIPVQYLERRVDNSRIIAVIMWVLELKTKHCENYRQRALMTFTANVSAFRFIDAEADMIYSFRILFELLKKNEFMDEMFTLFFEILKSYERLILYIPNNSHHLAFECTSLKSIATVRLDAHFKHAEPISIDIDYKELFYQDPNKDKTIMTADNNTLNSLGKTNAKKPIDKLPRQFLSFPGTGLVLKNRDISISFWFNVPSRPV